MPENKIVCGCIDYCLDTPTQCGNCRHNLFIKRSMFVSISPESLHPAPPPLPPKVRGDYIEKGFPKRESPFDESENIVFPNRGAFYKACWDFYKKYRKDINPVIAGLDLDKPEGRKKAWVKVVKKFDQPIKGG